MKWLKKREAKESLEIWCILEWTAKTMTHLCGNLWNVETAYKWLPLLKHVAIIPPIALKKFNWTLKWCNSVLLSLAKSIASVDEYPLWTETRKFVGFCSIQSLVRFRGQKVWMLREKISKLCWQEEILKLLKLPHW